MDGSRDVDDAGMQLTLTRDEAIVLHAWLARFNKLPAAGFEDQAEQRVLWDLEALLERGLAEPLMADYGERLRAARSNVRDSTD